MRYTLNKRIIDEALYRADMIYQDGDSSDEDVEGGGFDGYGFSTYSGRAMYDEQCFAIVHSNIGKLLQFISEIRTAAINLGMSASEGEDDYFDETVNLDWVRNARQDNMGMDTVTYFPGVLVEGHDRNAA
jgi:hypothetical protein